MGLNVINKPEKLEALRENLKKKYPSSLASLGKIVRYEMPALDSPFPRLAQTLEGGDFSLRFKDVEYYIQTEKGFIDRIYPASEYYKIAFRSIADSIYSMNSSVQQIRKLQVEIRRAFLDTRRTMPRTMQPSFAVTSHVYNLKGDLGNFFFVSRSLLDTLATLMHFLCGPHSDVHRSFSKFIEYAVKGKGGIFKDDTDTLKNYLVNNMAWYDRLKDVRDFGTHYKNLDISFYEQSDRTIKIFLEDSFEINELLESIQNGITRLFEFTDGYFTDRIGKALSGVSKDFV